MAELEASDVEVAALIDRDPQEVRDWRQGKTDIDADGQVLLRVFLADDPSGAERALERIRMRQTRNMVGEGAEHSGVTPPYGGGFQGSDAQAVPTIPPLPTPTHKPLAPVRDGERYGRHEA